MADGVTHIPRILRAFEGQVWALQSEKLQEIAEVIAAKAATGQIPTAADIEAAARKQRGQAMRAGATAVLPVFGTICQRMTLVDAMSGGCSLEEFGGAFRGALADAEVGRIVLRFDSPGGSVFGVEEAARLIAAGAKEKPVIAAVDPQAGSAAYWLASQADEVVVTPSGQAGSIGCYTVHFDLSEKLEEDGIRVTVIRGGAHKAEGNPYESLTPEAAAHLQTLVDFYDSAFTAAVARGRGVGIETVRDSFGQGRMFDADRLVRLGMADRVASFEDVIQGGAKRGRQMVALSTPEHMAALAAAAGETPAPIEALVEQAAFRFSALTRIHAAGGHAAPDIVPAPTQPAREAKGDTVEKNTAAQDAGAGTATELLDAERDRRIEVRALGREHGVNEDKIDQWIDGGVSVDQASAEILEQLRTKSKASPTARAVRDREAEAPFRSFGEQLQAIVTAGMPDGGLPDKRLLHLNRTKQNQFSAAATGASQGDPSSLGYVVAPQFSQMIWDGLSADDGNLLALTDSYPVEGESLTFNANAETSRATGSRWGGIRSYWIAEADQITDSKPKLRQVKIEPQELAVLVYLTNKLLRNAPAALEAYVTRAAVSEIGFMVSDAIIRGTGAGQPAGLLGSGSLVTVAKEASQAAATIVSENVSKMWARLHPRARRDAVWLANVDTEPEFDTLSVLVKNVAETENVGGYQPRVYNPETGLMKGRPVRFVEFCETLGTVGDLILWSPSGYVTGVRAGIESAMSIHLRFDYAESALRFMYEVDGQPWLASAQTPYKGSNTLTTHVALATRA